MKNLSKTQQSAAKTLHAAFTYLLENGGNASFGEITEYIAQNIEFSDWELEVYEKTGYTRWRSFLSFFSIDAKKAGYIRKKSGEWILTEEGEAVIKKLNPEELIVDVVEKYRAWKKNTSIEKSNVSEEQSEHLQQANLEQLEQSARDDIMNYLYALNPYEFQDIVGALLESMGYHVNFVAAKGKDGGIDLVAYQDPLGVKSPKIKVQVKHYTTGTKIAVSDIRSLVGILHKDSDVGLFVTSGQFSKDAETFARESHIHVELIDFEKFVELWTEYYPNLVPILSGRAKTHSSLGRFTF